LVFSSGTGNSRTDGCHKVNVDGDLIVQVMKDYFMVEKFGLVLLSGDGDFVPLVRFFETEGQFVKIISPTKASTSKMLVFDRFTKRQRFLTFIDTIETKLQKLTKKISLPKESGGIE
ncbi:MAG: NYN domain-containing protein, partial [Dolichospermum sp.]